ncbi:hypothetical protein ACFVX6_33080 [Streptomyces sp. NPDC058289]|uniref:hypothetical protein n=1 Tax=Streptomyces sp. NPDC058289 TaxID=3346425 RepID=UPI0036E84DF5
MKRSCGSSVGGVRPLLLLPVQAALMIGLGRLVTGPAAGHWPLSAEASIDRDLAEGRDPAMSGVTELFAVLAGTQVVVGAPHGGGRGRGAGTHRTRPRGAPG